MQEKASSTVQPSDHAFSRVGAISAALGLPIYATAAILHPGTPPHRTRTAFAEYAQEPFWGVIHLTELLGVLLMCVTGFAVAWRLRRGTGGVWALLAGAMMLVFGGVYAIFTAVDGVALGVLVRRLANASTEQSLYFETAFAVRQVEAGLFGVQWFVFGIAAGFYALAFFVGDVARRWSVSMAVLSGLASIGTLSFGVVQSHGGFSPLSMAFQTGLYFGVLWVVAAGVFLLRCPVPEHARGL